eukprot:762433-Hanusia_phi.AAC.4
MIRRAPYHLERLDLELVEDDVEELLDVEQQLLADALAGRVDRHLDAGSGKDQSRGEHADGDGLAEPARRAHQYLLCQMVPPVDTQHLLVITTELPQRLSLPEDTGTCTQEVAMELLLVVRPRPAPPVQRRQGRPAELHPLEPVHLPHALLPSLLLLPCRPHALRQRGQQTGRRQRLLLSSPPPLPLRVLPLPQGTEVKLVADRVLHPAVVGPARS